MFVASAHAQTAEGLTEDAAEGVTVQTETGIPADVHEGVFPPFDSTTFPSQLLWLALTFGFFYLFLKRVALPRISDILEHRRDRIAQDLDQAARLRQDAEEAMAAYEQELAEGRARAGQISLEARESAKESAEAARRATEAELEARLSEAESRIRSIKAAAMQEIGTIAEETTAALVERLLGKKATKAEVAAAVKAVSS